MSEVAGAPDGVDRGVYAGGANYKRGALSIGAVNYYSDDIINIFYTEAKYDVPLSERYKLKFAAQYSMQDSVGDELLTGGDFSTSQYGLKAELGVGNALFTTAWNSTDDDADLVSPWGSIPSYNSVQVQDFNRAGEDSLMLRAAYSFKSVAQPECLCPVGQRFAAGRPDAVRAGRIRFQPAVERHSRQLQRPIAARPLCRGDPGHGRP